MYPTISSDKGHYESRQTLAMNPKRYSQIERAIQCFDRSSTGDFLKDNSNLFLIFKKAERFVAALYILTELFPNAEPIKWELRSSGTSLSKDILSFRERSAILSKENMGDVFGTVIRIASLLEIAHVANLVSTMNLSLFRKELDTLASFMENRGKTGRAMGGDTPFQESFFHVSAEIPGVGHPSGEPSSPKTLQTGISHSRPRHPVDNLPPSPHQAEQPSDNQKDIVSKGHAVIKDSVLYDAARVDIGHNIRKGEERRQTILDVLKVRSVAVIKDFSVVIDGCSEKTVQRELLKMVQEGTLRREGERRWSRYSLA